MKILIVEDEEHLADGLRFNLEAEGYEAEIIGDGGEAVKKLGEEKFDAVVNEIKKCNAQGQPVLVGTISIDRSEKLSSLLKRAGLKHVVLNAKYHEKEAEIVAQAGRKGAVTIATNMPQSRPCANAGGRCCHPCECPTTGSDVRKVPMSG